MYYYRFNFFRLQFRHKQFLRYTLYTIPPLNHIMTTSIDPSKFMASAGFFASKTNEEDQVVMAADYEDELEVGGELEFGGRMAEKRTSFPNNRAAINKYIQECQAVLKNPSALSATKQMCQGNIDRAKAKLAQMDKNSTSDSKRQSRKGSGRGTTSRPVVESVLNNGQLAVKTGNGPAKIYVPLNQQQNKARTPLTQMTPEQLKAKMKRAENSIEKLTNKLTDFVYAPEKRAAFAKSKENYQKQVEAIKQIMGEN